MKVIKFSSENCAPCRASKPHWDNFKETHPSIQMEVVDVDKNPEVANQYKVMSVPTLVVEEDGVVKASRIGAFSLSTLEALVQ